MATTDFNISGLVGLNFNMRTTHQQYQLGLTTRGTANTQWIYVLASESVATGTCTVNGTTFVLTDTAGAHTADTAFASGEYGWVRATDQDVIAQDGA